MQHTSAVILNFFSYFTPFGKVTTKFNNKFVTKLI